MDYWATCDVKYISTLETEETCGKRILIITQNSSPREAQENLGVRSGEGKGK